MAFGLFKKKNTADVIYMNGHVCTQDPALPWASAVACSEGKILAVGDFEAMDEIVSDDTQIIDLNGRYLFPGFIETHGTEILAAFSEQYLEIDPVWDLDTVLEEVSCYADSTDRNIIFGYGFHEQVLETFEDPSESAALLDEIERDRPVILLGINGTDCWFNTTAFAIVSATAEDEGREYVSSDYILQVLSPLDFEEAEHAVEECSSALADRGITSFFPLNTPSYFLDTYRSCLVAMIGESIEVKQRLFGSLYLNRPIPPQLAIHRLIEGRTLCSELDDLISCEILKLEVSSSETLAFFSAEELKELCLAAAERDFSIHLDALDKDACRMADEAFRYIRSKGFRNTCLVLASDTVLPEDADAFYLSTWQTDYLNNSVWSHAANVNDALDLLTVKAAELLGISSCAGTIEQGKRADFTVFEENPLEKTIHEFSHMQASLTVIDGMIIHDLDQECDDEMFDLMLSMRL